MYCSASKVSATPQDGNTHFEDISNSRRLISEEKQGIALPMPTLCALLDTNVIGDEESWELERSPASPRGRKSGRSTVSQLPETRSPEESELRREWDLWYMKAVSLR